MSLTKEELTINEETSAVYKAVLTDGETGEPISLSDIESLTLTLRDVRSGEIINNRENQDVLNDNDVIVHVTSGLLTWSIQREDNIIANPSIKNRKLEEHEAIFNLSLTNGAGCNHRLRLYIEQFTNVT